MICSWLFVVRLILVLDCEIIRIHTRVGSSCSVTSGLLARMRLSVQHSQPAHVCWAQLQDMFAVHLWIFLMYRWGTVPLQNAFSTRRKTSCFSAPKLVIRMKIGLCACTRCRMDTFHVFFDIGATSPIVQFNLHQTCCDQLISAQAWYFKYAQTNFV